MSKDMTYNLFVVFELREPGDNIHYVKPVIESLGEFHQLQLSLYFVNTVKSPEEAYSEISQALTPEDRLMVINAAGPVFSNWQRPEIEGVDAVWR